MICKISGDLQYWPKSSRLEVLSKKGFLKKFAKFTGKGKIAGLRPKTS